MIMLGSLVLISPLAFFFGREYRQEEIEEQKVVNLEKKAEEISKEITQNVDEIVKEDKKSLRFDTLKKLKQIEEETEDLRR